MIELEEKSAESNVYQPNTASAPAARSDVKASKSNGTKVRQTTTIIDNTNSETDFHALADTVEPPVKIASKPSNPLDDAIDPDVPGIARLALTADFQSLVESGADVSTAVRFIDERIDDGKYGDEITRK